MGAWPVIGRESEISRILGGLQRGVGAIVVGEAGLGKSVLVDAVRQRLVAQGTSTELVVCSGRSDFPLRDLASNPDGPTRRNHRVLVIDDAHRLDDDSADVLWRLGREPGTNVVASVRSDQRAPDQVARLWTGGSCERLELTPLIESDVRTLLEVVLGGDVEDRLPLLLSSRASGNALLLRELVRSGVSSGAIVRSQNVWRLDGELPLGAGAADVIRGRLAELTVAELGAAQVLAEGEPLSIAIAESLLGPSVLEALEGKRVAALVETSHGPVVALGHPLYGEVLRTDIAPLRLRRLRRELISAFAAADALGRHDVLRSVIWRLDIGDRPDHDELVAAARLARAVSLSTAERLARAAIAADHSVEAVVLLAEILIVKGRIAESDALLDDLDLESLTTSELDDVTYSKALGRTRLGELGQVIAMVTGTEVSPAVNSLQLQAIYGQVLMLDGRVGEGTAVVESLLADPDADPVTRTSAACSVAAGAAVTGKVSDAERAMRESLTAAEAARAAMPFGVGTLLVATSISLATVGRLHEAEDIGRRLYERALAEDDEWSRPRGASALGVVALARGQARTATRHFRITVASLNDLDGQYLRYNLSWLARGAALAGFVEEARQALESGTGGPDFALFHADWLIAQAALLAAEGKFDLASEQALRAARHAASLGMWAKAGAAAHDAARYSAAPEAVQLIATAAEWVEGPLVAGQAEFARARQADDPRALSAVSVRFESLGGQLYAAEAEYAAARAYHHDGDGRAAARASVRAAALHARCENAPIPWAIGFRNGQLLTAREQQIALLAAAGKSDATISTELQISIRTVQNHLARTYRKLDVTNRQDLAAELPPPL